MEPQFRQRTQRRVKKEGCFLWEVSKYDFRRNVEYGKTNVHAISKDAVSSSQVHILQP